MSWNASVVDGSISVASNKSRLNGNSSYIQTTMRVDHFWNNANANLDGHHDVVEMPAQTSDPAISTDMKGITYVKETDKALASDGTTDEMWFKNAVGAFQMSGIYLTKDKQASLAGGGKATVLATSAKQSGIVMSWDPVNAGNGRIDFWRTSDAGVGTVINLQSASATITHQFTGANLEIKNGGVPAIKTYTIVWYSTVVE